MNVNVYVICYTENYGNYLHALMKAIWKKVSSLLLPLKKKKIQLKQSNL